MKYLYTNGCSFVWGDEIQNPNDSNWQFTHRWSKILSDKMGVEEINHAQNGSSNNRIYRTTKDWIFNNKDKLKDTFIVLGWSQSVRTERYNDIANMYESINFAVQPEYMSASDNNGMDASGDPAGNKDHGPFLGMSPSQNFWEQYVKYYFDDNYFNEETALRVFAMQQLLEKYNIKYYFYFSMENNVLHHIQGNYENLYNFDKIYHQCQEDWIMDEVKKKTGGILEWDNEVNTFKNTKGEWSGFNGSHPDEKSHSLWADFLYKEFRRLYK